jgi:xanthine/uracil permease
MITVMLSDHETVSLAMEAIGDITASAEVSRVAVEGYEFDTRIQGGVLGDGIGMFLEFLPLILLPNLLLRRPA